MLTSAFIATNIDDLAILVLLFALTHKKQQGPIFLGQTLGLVLISIMALLAVQGLSFIPATLLPHTYYRFLGLIPLGLGIKEGLEYLKRRRIKEDQAPCEPKVAPRRWWQISALVLANSGDNLAIYIPLYAPLSLAMRIFAVLLFAVLAFLWTYFGRYLASHQKIKALISPYSDAIASLVFIFLGLLILISL